MHKKIELICLNGEDKTSDVIRFAQATRLDHVTSGRYSLQFISEFYCHSMIAGYIDPFKVMAEINYLEGFGKSVGTKEESQFTGKLLGGLWHKHYIEDGVSSMAQNLQMALKVYGLPKLEAMVKDSMASGEERFMTEEDLTKVMEDAVYGNYVRRANQNRLTGEWIVYAKYNNNNYYLCLGRHTQGDAAIRRQIDNICTPDFPFLSEILPPQK